MIKAPTDSTDRSQLCLALCTMGLALSSLTACPREPRPTAEQTALAQASAPAAPLRIGGLYPLDVVSGSVPLRAETTPKRQQLAQLELWINDKPAAKLPGFSEHPWDTRATPDGLATLMLKASANGRQLASEPLTVVVLNKGGEVFFKNGSNGTVAPHPAGTQEPHLRFHWDQSTPSRKILALLSWPDDSFDLELAVGTGSCPHHGVAKATAHGTRAPLAVTYEPGPGEAFETGQWFAHVRLLNPEGLTGRQTQFEVRAFKLD